MNKIKLLVFLCFFSFFVFSQNTDTSRIVPPLPAKGDTIKGNVNTPPPPARKDSVPDYVAPNPVQQTPPNRSEPPHQKPKKYPKGYNDYKNGKGVPQESDIIAKLYYGCNVMLRAYRSTYGSVFYYDLSPHVGYMFNDYFSAGVQVIYNNSVISYGAQSVSYNIIGPGVFGRALLGKSNFFLQAEYDYLSVPSGYLGTAIKDRSWSDEKMFGIGYKSYLYRKSNSDNPSSGSVSYFINIMYDISPTLYSPYFGQPLIYRAGVVYNY